MRPVPRGVSSARSRAVRLVALALTSVLVSCEGSPPTNSGSQPPQGSQFCSIPENQIVSGGVPRDGIPALTDPVMTQAGAPAAEYLSPSERVIGIVIEGQAFAIPHRVLWVHEIMNLNVGGTQVAVTYCPLTGSSLAFNRAGLGGAEFGVSGLLFQNNLIMYDRTTNETLWPQMLRGAKCGPSTGIDLEMEPVVEMTWEGWSELHPETKVPAQDRENGQNFVAYRYPYGDYERIDNEGLLFPLPSIDTRRPPKERVLGVPTLGSPGAGVAFPFGTLDLAGAVNAVQRNVGSREIVVFWDRARQSAQAFLPRVGGQPLTLEMRSGAIIDSETGSRWTPQGKAVDGPLVGEQLAPVPEAYVAFWFAWAAFHSETDLWESGS